MLDRVNCYYQILKTYKRVTSLFVHVRTQSIVVVSISAAEKSRKIFVAFCKEKICKNEKFGIVKITDLESLKSSHTRLLVALVNIIFKFVYKKNKY